MEASLSIVFFVLTLVLLFALLRFIFLKSIVHFKLLKVLFPERLQGVNSYWSLMWITNYFKLDFEMMFWLGMPFYYTKIRKENIPISGWPFHERLLKINKKILLFILLFICDIVLIGTIGYMVNK